MHHVASLIQSMIIKNEVSLIIIQIYIWTLICAFIMFAILISTSVESSKVSNTQSLLLLNAFLQFSCEKILVINFLQIKKLFISWNRLDDSKLMYSIKSSYEYYYIEYSKQFVLTSILILKSSKIFLVIKYTSADDLFRQKINSNY